MSHLENRDKIVKRIERELIGPGSDIFLCEPDFSNEVIEGKPLQRYYSGILFPKQKATDNIDNGKESFVEDDPEETDPSNIIEPIEDRSEEHTSELQSPCNLVC